MGPQPWYLLVSTGGSSLISFAGGISGSKLVNLLDLDLVCQHGPEEWSCQHARLIAMPIDFTKGSSLTSLARCLDGSNWSNSLDLGLVS